MRYYVDLVDCTDVYEEVQKAAARVLTWPDWKRGHTEAPITLTEIREFLEAPRGECPYVDEGCCSDYEWGRERLYETLGKGGAL